MKVTVLKKGRYYLCALKKTEEILKIGFRKKKDAIKWMSLLNPTNYKALWLENKEDI